MRGLYSNKNKKHPLFSIWSGIVARCEGKSPEYAKYGGIGVRFDREWKEDIEAFAAYLGPRPSPKHSVDRFPNKNGHYEPGNVRWATPSEQIANRRKFDPKKSAQKCGNIPSANKLALKSLFDSWSAHDISQMLGISRQAVSKWEEVPIRTVKRLSEKTGIRPEILHPEPYY